MRVGIIGAMDVEVEQIRSELTGPSTQTVAGMEFVAGRLGATDAVVVKCGIGKVNAGICVQVLVDRFDVTHLINTGIAGSLDARLDIGDLVVATECFQHDYDVSPLGYAPGQIPGLDVLGFAADAALRQRALDAAAEVAPGISAVAGAVASGDQFVASEELKRRIVDGFGASCCEMEGAAIAQAAHLNGVPFVVVRAISDKPGSDAQVSDYATFEREAAHHCAAIVSRMVRGL